ncbi:MAG: outer membrane beta-barrel protein, partial [Planctomycetaceae bacterium]|nr:outer membrane beta-barrel protein [Planctomycetaceae bacterium]
FTLQDDAAADSEAKKWNIFKRDGKALDISGWTQFGYHDRTNARYLDDPLTPLVDEAGLFNDNPKKGTVHQVWFAFDKAYDADAEGLGFGYHVDVMFGADALDTAAFGNSAGGWDVESSDPDGTGFGWALPQLYLTTQLNDWEITVGKFYTIVGYEVVQAPGNFFYSHANTMYNSEPFSHTGILASKTTESGLDLTVGYSSGWDTGFQSNGSNGILGLGKAIGDNISLNYVTTFGDISGTENGYSHSIVMQIELGEKMDYVFQSDYVATNERYNIGVNQYVFYTVSEDISVGARLEWWRQGQDLGPGSEYSFTTGINYKPTSRFDMILRPEVRIDWNDASQDTVVIFGMDAIIQY